MISVKRIHLDLTNRCNLNCSYCYVSREKSVVNWEKFEMTAGEWLEIIDQAVTMGIKNFVISGGEPLSFSGISEIIERLNSHHVSVSLMTNLWEIDERIMKTIIESPAIKEIVTSWDGFAGHNTVRQPSNWHDIVNIIHLLRERRRDWRIVVNTVIHRYNIQEMEDLQRKVVELGVNVWRVDLPIKPEKIDILPNFEIVVKIASRLISNRYTCPELQKTELMLFRIYKSQLEGIRLDEAIAKSDTSLHPCDYFLDNIAIKPDGMITLCSPLQLKLAKIIRGTSLSETLKSFWQNNFFVLKISDLKDCRDCKYLMLCGGGCRADALRWSGNVNNADPISCLMMPAVEEIILPVLSPNLKQIYKSLLNGKGRMPRYNILPELPSIKKGGKELC